MPVVISPSGRRYDRNQPPPMPAHRMLTRGLPAGSPLYRDFRQPEQGGTLKNGTPFCGPVKNQGQRGACTAHDFASAIEWICRAYFKKQPILSPEFFYPCELIMDGNKPSANGAYPDVGSDGETGCKVAIHDGCCELSADPYDDSTPIMAPTAAQYANAAQYKMGAYHGITNSVTAISCLADPTPWPVNIGFAVFSSFESEVVAQTGVMPIPGDDEEELGGHQTLGGGGYDIGDVPTIRPAGCPPAILVQNSWDTIWGIRGFFWMPLQVLDQPTTDIKIVHSGRPW